MESEGIVVKSRKRGGGSLAPGFRFHPTDEELVFYYLRRKICKKPFKDAISDIDIYKLEPWDLPSKSRLQSRDTEWYFFSVLDKKYGNGSRTNRATDRGYWKTTGKDRPVYHRAQIVGMKKTLVYHLGRAPRGERSNWVMHEYRLIDEALQKAGILQDAFVLCRIFRKSGSGPKNGEQYGAPFVEEEWEDDEYQLVLNDDDYAVELPVSDDGPDAYLDEEDLLQIFSADDPLHEAPQLQNVAYADENNYLNESTQSFNEAQEVDPSHEAPLPSNIVYGDENHYVEECTNFVVDEQEILVGVDENIHVQEQPDDSALFNLPVQYDGEAKPVKHEYIGEPSYTSESCNAENPPVDADYFLDKSFLDATDDPLFGDETFIETNDLKQPEPVDTSSFDMLDEYLQYFDATDGNLQLLGFDYPNMMESEDLPSEPKASHISEDVIEGIKQEALEGKQQEDHINDYPSSSKQETTEFGSDFQYPFSKHASRMLGSIPAPPAFASDFSKKDAALRMNSASPSTIHVTAGIIRIRNLTLSSSRMELSFGKNGHLNVSLSFGLSRENDYFAESQPSLNTLSDKSDSAISRGWFCFMFMWVLFLTMSFKIGSFICAN